MDEDYLNSKKIEEIKRLVSKLIQEDTIKKNEEYKKLVSFYLELAQESLNSARVLYKVSTDVKAAEYLGASGMQAFLWVINPAYYSMFYTANAALASIGVKINSEIGIHKLTFYAFTYYFHINKKISAKYVQDFLDEQESAQELLGREEILKEAERKAKELVLSLQLEREKRRYFTYELERSRIMVKAKTSLERANDFFREVSKIIK